MTARSSGLGARCGSNGGSAAGMRWHCFRAFEQTDIEPQQVIHAAVQHEFAPALITPNPLIKSAPSGANRVNQAVGAVLQQSTFHQLLQIVTASRSGCVRLTYRFLAQVWQKKSVCAVNVQCSDRTRTALNATNRKHPVKARASHRFAATGSIRASCGPLTAKALTKRKHQDRQGASRQPLQLGDS